jgi:pantoate kinase
MRRIPVMQKTTAFAPCHITGIFQISDENPDMLMRGSRGAGISLAKGVRTTVTSDDNSTNHIQILINGRITEACQVSKHLLRKFLSKLDKDRTSALTVEHEIEMPVGAGFGTSGAAALSLAIALSKNLALDMSTIEAAQIAHETEVECKTGLGTVIAETYGGVEIRTLPGAPGIGKIRKIPVEKHAVVACTSFGPLSTRKLLGSDETRRRINELGGKLVDELAEKPTCINFMRLSRQFAEHVGLITGRVRAVLDETDKAGYVCSMPMFGETVFTITDQSATDRLLRIFAQHSLKDRIIVSEIDFEGARLLR